MLTEDDKKNAGPGIRSGRLLGGVRRFFRDRRASIVDHVAEQTPAAMKPAPANNAYPPERSVCLPILFWPRNAYSRRIDFSLATIKQQIGIVLNGWQHALLRVVTVIGCENRAAIGGIVL